ncbi:MAG: hypothetical protein JWN63_1166 [Candidatus Acidoferrum typicum]|nr:hypothetical protein [Candidatus Acidoferrum typicum]
MSVKLEVTCRVFQMNAQIHTVVVSVWTRRSLAPKPAASPRYSNGDAARPRQQLIYAATLPAPGEDAKALGEKRFQAFLGSVTQMMARGADNDNELPLASKADEA